MAAKRHRKHKTKISGLVNSTGYNEQNSKFRIFRTHQYSFEINHFFIFSNFNPARAASLVCLSSSVRKRSALIDKAEAT